MYSAINADLKGDPVVGTIETKTEPVVQVVESRIIHTSKVNENA